MTKLIRQHKQDSNYPKKPRVFAVGLALFFVCVIFIIERAQT